MSFHKDLAGEDLHGPANESVENNTGSTITSLKVVKYNGIGTSLPQITPITALTDEVAGIVGKDIAIGEIGQISAMGFLFNVNTAAFPVGTLLYSDASGDLSTTPSSISVGAVIVSNSTTGVILVKVAKPPVVVDVPGYVFVANATLATENGATFINHLTLSTTITISGTYRYRWYCEYGTVVPGTRVGLQITTDVNSTGPNTISSLEKVNDPAAIALSDHNGFSSISLSAGDTFDLALNFRTLVAGNLVAVLNSRLDMERVGA